MPIITIQGVADSVTREQKARLVRGVTDLVHEVMAKPPERVYVVIEEVALDNWGVGGDLLSDRRAAGATGICDCGAHEEFIARRQARTATETTS